MAITVITSAPNASSAAVSVEPAKFPKPPTNPTPVDPAETASKWLSKFNDLVPSRNPELQTLFTAESYWRDHLCLSFTPHTLITPQRIYSFLSSNPQGVRIRRMYEDPAYTPKHSFADYYDEVPAVEVWLLVETDVGSGRGLLKLVEEDGEWKAFTLTTNLMELRGFEESINLRRPRGDPQPGNTWREERDAEKDFKNTEPAVLVIGAGQCGLATAARLKMLGVPTLVIEKSDRVGECWRSRYESLVLHDPVYYDQLPYLSFPSSWPLFTPKDKMADWLEIYATALDLNVWTSTLLTSTSWDNKTSTWTVTLQQGNTTRTLKPRHIVLATGHHGEPLYPAMPGKSEFAGRIYHSADYLEPAPTTGKQKKVVVVGSARSGHDVAQDYYEAGWDVTMVQRGTTHVVTGKSVLEYMGLKGLYDGTGMSTDDADMRFLGMPTAVLKAMHREAVKKINKYDHKYLGELEQVGFKLDDGPQGSGFMTKYFETGGGYYLDIGCSALIISGAVKIKQGYEISRLTKNTVVFGDGSELEADEIVCATGFQNMRTTAERILGKENVVGLPDIWGTDEEGELRGAWRRTERKGLWVTGGILAVTRYWSRMMALQIKALEEGIIGWEDW